MTARALAQEAGAEDMIVFTPDEQLGALLPASGFLQTLPNGQEWHDFLDACRMAGTGRATLSYPSEHSRVSAIGKTAVDGSVLVLLGGVPREDALDQFTLLLPLLAAALAGERTAIFAQGNARLAAEAANHAKILTASLDNARQGLRKALADAEEANRAKDRFLAALSHELRTPLTPVLMSATVLAVDENLPEDVRDDIGMIRRNVELEVRLIDDLLDLSRVTSGKLNLRMESVDVHDCIRAAVRICRGSIQEKGVRLKLDLGANGARMVGDATRLQQVLWNLLKNAVKFTPAGGEVNIETIYLPEHRVRIGVRDSGIGICASELPNIFNAFQQAHGATSLQFGGLGLGLAIAKAIVELHGGTIMAESPGVGAGATFAVEFPLDRARLLEGVSGGTESQTEVLFQPCKILIAEDHADTARLLARLLSRSGHMVQTCGTVVDSLRLLAEEQFDVLLSDIGLPDATGYDLMRKVRGPGLIGIAMSGFALDEDLQRSKEAGFAEHLVKPVNVDQLQSTIQRLIRLGREAANCGAVGIGGRRSSP